MDDVGFEQLFVLPHIQYNGADAPITFFDLIIDVQSSIRGQELWRLRGVASGIQ